MLGRSLPLLVALLTLSSAAGGEGAGGDRLLHIGGGATCAELDEGELRAALQSYLAGLEVELLAAEEAQVPLDRARALEIMAGRGATLALWCEAGEREGLVVHIVDRRGPAPLERTLEVGYQPAPVLCRTVAAVVRSVIESGVGEDELERGDPADGQEAPGPAEEAPASVEPAAAPCVEAEAAAAPPAPEVAPGAVDPGPTLGLVVAAGYLLRAGQRPEPVLNGFGLRAWLQPTRWLMVGLSGRFALPTALDRGQGGTLWRAGVALGLGPGRRLERVTLGLLLGLDLEWHWGAAALGRDEPDRAFDALSVGVGLDGVLSAVLWRGLVLSVVVTAVARPKRIVLTLHGEPLTSAGHIEAGAELTLGWRFM